MLFLPARVQVTRMLNSVTLLQSTTPSSSVSLPRLHLARFATTAALDPSDDDDDDDDKVGFEDEPDEDLDEDHDEDDGHDDEGEEGYYDDDSDFGDENSDERRADPRDLFNYSEDDVDYGELTGINLSDPATLIEGGVDATTGENANTAAEQEDLGREYSEKLEEYYSKAGTLSVAEAFEQHEKRWHIDRLSSFSRPEKLSAVLTDIEELLMERIESYQPKELADSLQLMSRFNDVFIFDPDFFRMAEERTLQTLEHWRVRDIAAVLMTTVKLPQWQVSPFFLSALTQRVLELRDECSDDQAEKIVQIATSHEQFKEPSPNWVAHMLRHVPDAEGNDTVTRLAGQPGKPDEDDNTRSQKAPKVTTYRVKFTPEDFAHDDQYCDHPDYARYKRLQEELIEEEGDIEVPDPSRWYVAPEEQTAEPTEPAVDLKHPTGRDAINSYRIQRLLRKDPSPQRQQSSSRAVEADDGDYHDFDVDDGLSDDDVILSDDEDESAVSANAQEDVPLEPEAPIGADGRRKFNPRAIDWGNFDLKSFDETKYDFTGVDLEGFAKESFPNMSSWTAKSVSAAQRKIDRQAKHGSAK